MILASSNLKTAWVDESAILDTKYSIAIKVVVSIARKDVGKLR